MQRFLPAQREPKRLYTTFANGSRKLLCDIRCRTTPEDPSPCHTCLTKRCDAGPRINTNRDHWAHRGIDRLPSNLIHWAQWLPRGSPCRSNLRGGPLIWSKSLSGHWSLQHSAIPDRLWPSRSSDGSRLRKVYPPVLLARLPRVQLGLLELFRHLHHRFTRSARSVLASSKTFRSFHQPVRRPSARGSLFCF